MFQHVSDLLRLSVSSLSAHSSNDKVEPHQLARIDKALEYARTLLDFVEKIEADVPLKVIQSEILRPENLKSKEMSAVIEHSELLGALYRAGIDFKSHEVFDPDLFALADVLAGSFHKVGSQLRAYRASRKGHDEGTMSFLTRGGEGFSEFLGLLEGQRIASIERTLLRKDSKWTFFKPEWRASSSDAQEILVVYRVIDANRNHFLYGDWMTAFIFNVIREYLTRNKIRHEIFAKVAYSAPVDIITSRSDFDIVVLIGGTALVFECKTGRIELADAAEITGKAADISKVLHRFVREIAQFRFFAIFDETLNDEAAVRKAFAVGELVEPKRIDEIRELIFDMFSETAAAPAGSAI